jgi:hypothetical protein
MTWSLSVSGHAKEIAALAKEEEKVAAHAQELVTKLHEAGHHVAGGHFSGTHHTQPLTVPPAEPVNPSPAKPTPAP